MRLQYVAARRQNACAALHSRDAAKRTDRARRRSGPWDVCTSMKWGVRIALSTSDHFAAPGQLKLRFSAAPGPDPWHGVPGVMQCASAAREAIDLASSFACSIIVLRRRLGVRIGAGCS